MTPKPADNRPPWERYPNIVIGPDPAGDEPGEEAPEEEEEDEAEESNE